MNDCPNGAVRDRLPDLLHDRLSSGERAEMASHLAGCAECRAELALLGELRGAMRATSPVDVDAIARSLPAYRAPSRRSPAAWRIAAVIAFIAAGGTSLAVLGGDRDREATAGAGAGGPARVAASRPAPDPGVATGGPSASGQGADGPAEPARESVGGTPVPARELALAGGALDELSEDELTSLLREIDELDALPSDDVDEAAPAAWIDSVGSAS